MTHTTPILREPSMHTLNRINMLQMVAGSFKCAIALPVMYTDNDINECANELSRMIDEDRF